MNGANPNARDNDGRLPLHWATASRSVEALELLLKESQYNVDVTDGSDMTPLMWSCYNKNELIAKRLIELGADVHEKDTDGRTAAHWIEADTGSLYSGGTDGYGLVSESVSFIAPSEYANRSSVTGIINHYLGYFIPGDNKSEFFFHVLLFIIISGSKAQICTSLDQSRDTTERKGLYSQ
uniref:Uncharacterized protein n=1 Tax=Amphimedon queenslandica TaxID=400682 RepID=A0A1X7TSE8_AMPQE